MALVKRASAAIACSAFLWVAAGATGAGSSSPVASSYLSGTSAAQGQISGQKCEVDLSQAVLMLDFLENLREEEKSSAALEKVLAAEGTRLIVAQMNLARKASRAQYEQLLRGLREGTLPDIPPLDSTERARRGVEGLRGAWVNLQWGAEHTPILRRKLEFIRGLDLYDAAYQLAQRHLPAPQEVQPCLFVVMGGRVGAAALSGDRIYYDMLTMSAVSARHGGPDWTESDVVDFFAHEIHHLGYRRALAGIRDSLHLTPRQRFTFRFLSGVLSEGSATYLLDGHRDLARLQARSGFAEVLNNSEKYLKRCQNLLLSIEAGDIATEEDFDRAAGFLLGNTNHAIGSYLLAVIDTSLGTDALMAVVADPRRLLLDYNRAMSLSGRAARSSFVFDQKLAEAVSTLGQ